ncbi:MAG: glycosyltransferase family 1 protein [Sterolibacterium sp.]
MAKIALVTETYPPEVNGVAMTLHRLVEGVLQRGHSVQLVRPRQYPGDMAVVHPGYSEILVPGLPIPGYDQMRFGLPARRSLRQAWSGQRPDIVHVATEGPLGWSAVTAARELGLPISSGFHTNFDAYSRHYRLGWLKGPIGRYLRYLHNRTDVTLVPTSALQEQLRRQGYRNVAVVSRGVDTRLFNPARRSAELRSRWGASPDDLVVCYVGRLAAEKNLDLVLQAVAAIHKARAKARMVFVGEGPQLKALVRQYPQYCFAGLRRGADLAEHYASADLFLFPSLTETFGNVTAEALASGLAVVAYNCAGAADLIENGRNGLLAAPGHSRGFIDAAVALASDDRQRTQIRHRAAPSVAQLDWESIHDRFIAALIRCIDGNEGGSASPQALGSAVGHCAESGEPLK